MAKLHLKSFLARSMASVSASSTYMAAAVVAVAGIAFRVLVGEHGAGGLQHGAGDDVLRGDQLDLVLLAFELAADDAGDLRVALGQGSREDDWLAAPSGARRRRWASPSPRIGRHAGLARGPHITGLAGPTRRREPMPRTGDARWGYPAVTGASRLSVGRDRMRCRGWRVGNASLQCRYLCGAGRGAKELLDGEPGVVCRRLEALQFLRHQPPQLEQVVELGVAGGDRPRIGDDLRRHARRRAPRGRAEAIAIANRCCAWRQCYHRPLGACRPGMRRTLQR